jgi:hypothetical protein
MPDRRAIDAPDEAQRPFMVQLISVLALCYLSVNPSSRRYGRALSRGSRSSGNRYTSLLPLGSYLAAIICASEQSPVRKLVFATLGSAPPVQGVLHPFKKLATDQRPVGALLQLSLPKE